MNPLAQELLDSGWKPKRALGQNFLFDANFLDWMVRGALLHADDVVVEFGTGPGQLTERLAARCRRVFTIEVDPKLHEFAKARVAARNVVFFLGDALPGGRRLSPDFVKEIVGASESRPIRVVSNFPYAIGGSILLALAEQQLPARDAFGTLQSEVADRLTAKPGEEAYGPLGILIGRRASATRVREVPRQLFWPEPKVHSAVVQVEFGEAAGRDGFPTPFAGDWEGYKAFVKSVFSQRRKTLGSGLKRLGRIYQGSQAMRRPEELSPQELEIVWRECRESR